MGVIMTVPVLESMVATAVLLLVYVIAPPPVAAPLGAVVIENAASALVLEPVIENVDEENADVALDTVNVLLLTDELSYTDVCA